MKHILLLDNYDSFTFNLQHYLVSLDVQVDVIRNDHEIMDLDKYDGIVISPGPGLPKDAGVLMEVLSLAQYKIPVLGVCLGMQGMCEFLGGTLYNQKEVKHGVQELIEVFSGVLFKDLSSEIKVGLYHSWAVSDEGDYDIVARSKGNVIMAIENNESKFYGVQFHPESIMTTDGMIIVKNFIDLI